MFAPQIPGVTIRLAVAASRARLWLATALAGLAALAAAAPPETKPTAEATAFFEREIRPLLVQECQECHTAGDANGGLRLDSREGWQAGGDSGAAIQPAAPDASLLIEAVRYKNLDLQMPPSGRLADDQIALLEKWVAMGAPDPREAGDDQTAATAPTGMSVAEGRTFWSFQPVDDPPVPTPQAAAWVRTPVDAFVLAQLEQAQLQPAPPASKRTLIRRVSYDLTGLPPTPQQVDAFLQDDSPQALERLVERLLASPQYGERWGRHWLDVARYADSNGLDENLAFGNAWRYRDYVIDAFNDDKPFDRFLIEQLAGDLIPGANRETKTATGFLVLGAKVLAEPDREKLMMDTVDEQLDSVGKAFLGMTLGCARCHDHKFDPIRQQDYYSLAAIFKSTATFADSRTGAILHWNEHSFASAADRAALAEVDAAIAAKKSAAAKFKNEAMARLRQQAEQQAASYLAAASQFSPEATLKEVARVAAPHGLHPRILHHCRLHLAYHREAPFFRQWHERVAAGASPAAIEAYFQTRFDAATDATKPTEADAAEADEAEQAQRQRARDALRDRAGFLAVPPKPAFAFDDATLKEYNRLLEAARLVESAAPDEPAAMGVEDGTVLAKLPIHIRGSHRNLGEPVERAFPAVMRFAAVRPILPRQESGRLQLARWMADSRHPLTARVYVNRLWGWHFGRGLVGSTENFGVLGERPSHPELLDWLTRYFIESGWSTKALHRLLLRSSVYQMAARHPHPAAAQAADPENRWLWRFRRQRLEAEQIRDAILAVSGGLNRTMGGKTIPLRNRQFVFNHTSVDHTKYDSRRRALYLPVIRNNLYSFFQQFDFPDPTMPTGSRQATVVAPQALLLMNNPLVMDAAADLAEQTRDETAGPAAWVRRLYEKTLSRLPTDREIEQALQFVAASEKRLRQQRQQAGEVRLTAGDETAAAHTASPRGGVDAVQAWALFCQALLASNEFIYLE